ncbi:10 kDa chaperonin, mitochondrial [Glycine max]|uniref:10 kDa chaperonin, mitochondrial n=1 Tax=Glycine max TaxID=3847 RepID=UPI001B35587B|nr:10 kDa chaperonin, mitochondrial-like [Glycine max]
MWCARHVDSHVTLGDLTRVTVDLTRISNLTEDLAFSLSCPTQLSSLLQSPLRIFNRVLVEKIVPSSKTNAGILLPGKSSKLNFGKVIAVGPGFHSKNGKLIPMAVKEGDTVLLPEYGGTEVKLDNKEYWKDFLNY